MRTDANIGRRLRELRLARGAQQADVARHLGVSAAYLNLMEKGKRAVPAATTPADALRAKVPIFQTRAALE